MLTTLRRQYQLLHLKQPEYRFLFDTHQEEIVSIDCETTSLKVPEAELLSIGAVKIRQNRILASESFYCLVKPSGPLNKANIKVHGLRPRDVSSGMQPADAIANLLQFIQGRPLLGYYLEYDIAVLNKYIKPLLGICLPNPQIELSGKYYDYKLKQHPDAYIDLRLANIQHDLNITGLDRHDALNDALTTAMLYLALKQRYPAA